MSASSKDQVPASAGGKPPGERMRGCRLDSAQVSSAEAGWGQGGPLSQPKPLRVMKFGGTSVGDASCIARAVDIIQAAAHASEIVVVVSAMSGVTNKLIEAALHAETGNGEAVAGILEEVSERHEAAVKALVPSSANQAATSARLKKVLEQGHRICQDIVLRRKLTAAARDSVSSLGERLNAPLVAAALAERGWASQAIEATELVVTDDYHGAADPLMTATRERCQSRLRPLLEGKVIPVVTGFIGATNEGVLTTLGRGGSDYSAAILGAALAADEVIIWTDVDGMLTADPRLVSAARIIPEISYSDASALSYFGAKVLHPKTVCAVMQFDIPLSIRNTFAPDRAGTRITRQGRSTRACAQGVTAVADAALFRVEVGDLRRAPQTFDRVRGVVAGVRADVLLLAQASAGSVIHLGVSCSAAQRTLAALRGEFSSELDDQKIKSIVLDDSIAILTVVGQDIHTMSAAVQAALAALGRQKVDVRAGAASASGGSVSFAVAKQDLRAALEITHLEFDLGEWATENAAGLSPLPARGR